MKYILYLIQFKYIFLLIALICILILILVYLLSIPGNKKIDVVYGKAKKVGDKKKKSIKTIKFILIIDLVVGLTLIIIKFII